MMSLHNQEVTVKRTNLLETLKKNRDIHLKEYLQAVEGFHVEAEERVRDWTRKIMAVKPNDFVRDRSYHSLTLSAPQNHTKEYDDVIEMLEMSVDETIILDSSAFRAYVKDEWTWTASTKMLNGTYAAKASIGSSR